ncbi:MAG: lysostaphin resistance A-like protein [Candidatus Thorarchaeota archaeon]
MTTQTVLRNLSLQSVHTLSNVEKEAKKQGIKIYLIISFALAWLFFGLIWIMDVSPWDNILVFQGLLIVPGFSPALAAIFVRKWITKEGLANSGLKLHLRQKWRYYLIAWLLPLVVLPIIITLAILIGTTPDFTLQNYFTTSYPDLTLPPEILPTLFPIMTLNLIIMTVPFSLVLWGEEYGWRGYLQKYIVEDQPVKAAIITGIIWGFWHFPIILLGYQYPKEPILGLGVFTLAMIVLSIIFGWLQEKTQSIWASSLAHSATNNLGAIVFLLFMGTGNFLFVGYLGLFGIIPLGILSLWIVKTGQLNTRRNKN